MAYEILAMQEEFARAYLEAIHNATAEEQAAAFDRFEEAERPSILEVNGSEATVSITGPLSPKGPSPIARFFGFGGTAYQDIVAAFDKIKNDPAIESVRLRMDTPGGTVAGMDSARQAIESARASGLRVVAENHGLLASAGYYLATAAGRIEATAENAWTGSLGIIVAGMDTSRLLERAGVKQIRIVSRNAPNKAPDPTTDKGLAAIQEQVDAAERVFIAKVAEGRGVTEEKVKADFGKGGILIAMDPDQSKPDAVRAGMIDAVVTASGLVSGTPEAEQERDGGEVPAVSGGGAVAPVPQAAEGGGQHEGAKMDLNQLKAEHPALYQAAVAVGVEQGIEAERDRVSAHMKLGKASGDLDYAASCIESGKALTDSVRAHYMAADMSKKDKEARADEAEDDLEVAAAEGGDSFEKDLAAQLAEKWGVEA